MLLTFFETMVRGRISRMGRIRDGAFSTGKKVPPKNIIGVMIKLVRSVWSPWDLISMAEASPRLAKIKAFRKRKRKNSGVKFSLIPEK
jgi:hypothetical protein